MGLVLIQYAVLTVSHDGGSSDNDIATTPHLRTGDGAENFVLLRWMGINLLKRHPAPLSLKRRRFKATFDTAFLFELPT